MKTLPRLAIPTVLRVLILTLSAGGVGFADQASDREFFERKIRPIFAENCLGCHGAEKPKGGLRLDSRSAALKGGGSGPAIVPGDPENSLLIEAIRREGALKMPPKKPLPPDAAAAIDHWIKGGAFWPEDARSVAPRNPLRDHWAFQPLRKPSPPKVRNASTSIDSIDLFILGALETANLGPSPIADRRTLIRRATFDVTGLPPTIEEISAFEADRSPDAYERVIDRLLAAPRLGERWARHWLDVSRYSDTKGYVFFQDAEFPWAYTYRDYVIRSFNEDLPYDAFIVQQLAADKLPLGEDRRPLTALGFLTLGGRFINNEHDIIDDRIDVVTRGLLGLTVTCARCHDHKFDPIPTKDYYSLYGVFASTAEPPIPPLFEPPPATKEYASFEAELKKRESALEQYVRLKYDELINFAKRRAAEYMLAANAARNRPNTEEFMLLADGSDLNPHMIIRWQAFLERTRKSRDPIFTIWHALAAIPEKEFAAAAPGVLIKIVEEPRDKPPNALLVRAFTENPPRTLEEAARIQAKLMSAADLAGIDVELRAKLNGAKDAALPDASLEDLRRVYRTPGNPTDIPFNPLGDLNLLPDRPSQATLQSLVKAVETWRKSGAGAPPRAMSLVDAATPWEPRVFIRGNPNNLGEPTPRRFLEALSEPDRPSFRDGSGRLELAKAIISPKNPLTARVIVNRVWQRYFGTGLVTTPSDFGTRGEPPSNPELLDELATRFVSDGWSLKSLHRRILLSHTYRQSSEDRSDLSERDPENRLLGRMNRKRLDFETTRDAILSVAGRLEPTLGGPPFPDVASPTARRRTLYAKIDRLNLPGIFRTFDFPDPNATSPKRDETTVAPQSLFLMNHPFLMEAAKSIASRPEIAGAPDRHERVRRIFSRILGREPRREETLAVIAYLDRSPDPSRAWRDFAHALLVSNEFVFID